LICGDVSGARAAGCGPCTAVACLNEASKARAIPKLPGSPRLPSQVHLNEANRIVGARARPPNGLAGSLCLAGTYQTADCRLGRFKDCLHWLASSRCWRAVAWPSGSTEGQGLVIRNERRK
jgi:hypothetical protein